MTLTPYQELEDRFRRINALGGATGILHWDMSTMMPSGGAESRAEQLAVLNSISHSMITDPAISDLLNGAEADPTLDTWQLANVREMRRTWVHQAAIDAKLVEAMSLACSKCETVWRDARKNNDFKSVLPHLEEVLRLTREMAAAKSSHLGLSNYDALLDAYEPDGKSADIDVIFDDLAAFLPGFTDEVLERQKSKPSPKLPSGPFPIPAQRKLAGDFMKTLGFDFNHGRLDESLHPFCGGTNDDVRITTRYDEADFTTAMMGVLHETGHALYDMGLPKKYRGQPVGDARGMSIHESQSLLIEMQACRSPEFIGFAAPLMAAAFNGNGDANRDEWSVENMTGVYTQVEKGFIRVDADEVTYPSHIILRYQLEKAAINGELQMADLPTAWNDGLEKLLGIRPKNDTEGCLQDIHWYDGAWGYFPTYTLGAMTAAQLFDAACKANPKIKPSIAKGDFSPLITWLRKNVHGLASSVSSSEIIKSATGQPLNASVFKAHLKTRYA
ncbi:MAG: carboxypeptidase M32 [Rhodospirillaceae bacterium]|nr:carboxypeptidase M32 [Rhodospirillaceae bacterium]